MEANEVVASILDALEAFEEATQEQMIEQIRQEWIARKVTRENVLLGSDE